jgi:hypothetical protein
MLRTPNPLTATPVTGRRAPGAQWRSGSVCSNSARKSAPSSSIRDSTLAGGVTNLGFTRMRRVRTAFGETVSVWVEASGSPDAWVASSRRVVSPVGLSRSTPISARQRPSASRTNGTSRSCHTPVTDDTARGALTAR